MASPQTEAEMKRAMETLFGASDEQLSAVTFGQRMFDPPKPPTLRGWWYRQWCALRGHGGITHYPGSAIYYFHEGLCKRCGDRVNCS